MSFERNVEFSLRQNRPAAPIMKVLNNPAAALPISGQPHSAPKLVTMRSAQGRAHYALEQAALNGTPSNRIASLAFVLDEDRHQRATHVWIR